MMAGKVAAAREALVCDLGELQRGYLEQVRGRGVREGDGVVELKAEGWEAGAGWGVSPLIRIQVRVLEQEALAFNGSGACLRV